MFVERHGDVCELEEEGEIVVVSVIGVSHPQRKAKPKISGSFAAVHRERWCVAEKWRGTQGPQCGRLVHLEGYIQAGVHPLGRCRRSG